tara:strand:- start:686 stop:1786 length:1101 start_codon:yes stop_codon:yes gene_type:complete
MNIRLEKIAKELLIDEDCVIIPEFGGFITHYKPALLEPNKNIILPPGKSVSFNAKLCKNDGLLAQNVALKTGLNYNDALKAIQLKVHFWEDELQKSKYLELEGFGSFILNEEENLVFEQFNETNFSSDAFGLTNVHASPIERVGLAQRIERGLDQKKASPKIIKTIRNSSVAAAVILSAVFIGLQLTKGDTNENLSLSFTPVIKSEKTIKTVDEKTIDFVKPESKQVEYKEFGEVLTKEDVQCFKDYGHLKEPENLEKIKEIQTEKATIDAKFNACEQVNSADKTIETRVEPKFHVIAGCFGVESNAIKMVQKLKNEGFTDAQLAGKSKSGLLRVSYGSYHKKIVALKALAKAKLSHNVNAWLAKN